MRVPRSPHSRSRRPLAALAGGPLALGMVTVGLAATAATAAPAAPAAAAKAAGDTSIENALIKLGDERDSIVSQMKGILYGAAFAGQPVNVGQASSLIGAANHLLGQASALAA